MKQTKVLIQCRRPSRRNSTPYGHRATRIRLYPFAHRTGFEERTVNDGTSRKKGSRLTG